MTKEEILKKLEPILVKKENLKVGQKLWSIQLGECSTKTIADSGISVENGFYAKQYYWSGNYYCGDEFPALFTQNPFEYLLSLTQQSDLPEYGEEIIVWDDMGKELTGIFVSYVKGASMPVIVVFGREENKFKSGLKFHWVAFPDYRRITKPAELTDEQKLAELVKHFPEIMAIVKK